MKWRSMFLRSHTRKKNGKLHRYWSVVASRRVGGTVRGADGRERPRVVQRQVLYLGEINDSQEAAWRKSITVFDESRQRFEQLALFPADRPIPPDEANALSLRVSDMRLLRPRAFGNCWLACRAWDELELSAFWDERLSKNADQSPARGDVPWRKVLQLLAVNRLCEPGTEFMVHRRWFDRSAMDQLLGVDFSVAAKDRLYRCLDRILPHKEALFQHLQRRWKTLFNAEFDVLLYDLTSTYFEGSCEQIPKAKHGYSRDGRPDCRQVVIALVVTTDGLPLAYEVLPGNTADKTTLKAFLAKIESQYGKARRVWVMDRGVPTEETLTQMREDGVAYLVGTPRHLLSKVEKQLIEQPWERVHEGVEVKLVTVPATAARPQSPIAKSKAENSSVEKTTSAESSAPATPATQSSDPPSATLATKDATFADPAAAIPAHNELYVLARSLDRQKKEQAMRRRKLKTLVHGLNRLKHRAFAPDTLGVVSASSRSRGFSRDTLIKKIAILQKEAGQTATFVKIREPKADEAVNRETFVCKLDRAAWRAALERDGCYILRGYLPWDDLPPEQKPPQLWAWYMQLVQVEEAFKTLKGDLHLRPIHHQLEHRVEAHILVAFLGYCLSVTLRMRLKTLAPGLTPREVLATLATIQMLDVQIPTSDGRTLLLPRTTEPTPEQQLLLSKLKLELPPQPPPRYQGGTLHIPNQPTQTEQPAETEPSAPDL